MYKVTGNQSCLLWSLLAPVLLAKLPPDLRLVVSRRVSHSDLDMDALLEEELIARERANPWQSRRSQEIGPHTASTLFSDPKINLPTLSAHRATLLRAVPLSQWSQ